MRTPPTKADYDRIARELKGPRTMTVFVVAIFYRKRFNHIASAFGSKVQSDAYIGQYNRMADNSPWSARVRRVKVTWPAGKAGQA